MQIRQLIAAVRMLRENLIDQDLQRQFTGGQPTLLITRPGSVVEPGMAVGSANSYRSSLVVKRTLRHPKWVPQRDSNSQFEGRISGMGALGQITNASSRTL